MLLQDNVLWGAQELSDGIERRGVHGALGRHGLELQLESQLSGHFTADALGSLASALSASSGKGCGDESNNQSDEAWRSRTHPIQYKILSQLLLYRIHSLSHTTCPLPVSFWLASAVDLTMPFARALSSAWCLEMASRRLSQAWPICDADASTQAWFASFLAENASECPSSRRDRSYSRCSSQKRIAQTGQ